MKSVSKKLFRFVLLYLGRGWAHIFSYPAMLRLVQIKKKLYTNWISSEFKLIGSDSTIGYPIVLRGGKCISIGSQTGLGERGVLTAWETYKRNTYSPTITIGNNVSIGDDYHITAINKIEIGNNVLMGKKVTITDNAHGKTELLMLKLPPIDRPLYSKGPVIIEDGVWIGDKVTILSGVRIEKNSIIGANALVTKNIPSNCIAGGVPAKIIKEII